MRRIKCSSKLDNKSLRSVKAADFDAEAFRKRHEDAADRRKSKQSANIINQIRDADEPIETAFELLVPASGKADTVAGELVRALMRLLYRDYNDGDVFYEGYGIETCGDAVAFLCDKIPELEEMFENIAMKNLRDDQYTDGLKEIADETLDYIFHDPELVSTKNTEDMFDYDGEQFIEDRDWEHVYEFSCDLPENVYRHLDAGNVSSADIEYEIEGWDGMEGADIQVDSNGQWVSIQNLKKDAYDLCEDSLERWLEQYGDDLDQEYELPEEDDMEEE